MTIESIELKNYRNYEELHMELSQGTNILYGDNAQGKTNILEAVYVCCTTKSHRGAKDRDMIRFGEDESHIKLQIKKGAVPCRIDMHLKKNKTKGIAVDGIPIRKASQLFGLVNVVFFSPEDLNIIKNGPSERRRFIDMELCQLDKVYVHSLVQYNKVLLQRNKLLKELGFHPEYEATLDVWDEQLVRFGKEVIKARRAFIDQLGDIIKELHTKLSGGKENIEVIYDPDTEEEELERVFSLVNNYLDPEGIFLFDMNTIYKYQTMIGDATIAENREEGSFIWENSYDEETGINTYELALFLPREDGLYEKTEEVHYQRAYSLEKTKELLEKAGLEFIAVYDAYTMEPPKKDSGRLTFVVREHGKKMKEKRGE